MNSLKKDPQDRRSSDYQLLKLDSRLEQLCNSMKFHHTTVNDKLESVAETQTKILHSIYGNGKEGILTKMARIEVKQATFKWISSSLAMSILGLAMYILQRSLV